MELVICRVLRYLNGCLEDDYMYRVGNYIVKYYSDICFHNHPSGDPTPSKEDINLTKNLNEIGKMHAIYLVDHLIIGKDCYFSFYENNCVLNTK